MQEMPNLRRWEKWGLAGLILGLGVLRLFDARGEGSSKPDLLEYANAALQFAVHIVAIWGVFNARRLVEWLFGVLAAVLIERGVVIAVPTPKEDQPGPYKDESAEQAATRGYQQLLRKADLRATTELHRARVRKEFNDLGVNWMGPIVALVASITLVTIFFSRPQIHNATNSEAAPASDHLEASIARTEANESCVPDYCSSNGAGYVCVLPSGGDPTSVARQFLSRNATNEEVARLALQIWDDNRRNSELANRTDRQIPANTALQIRSNAARCD